MHKPVLYTLKILFSKPANIFGDFKITIFIACTSCHKKTPILLCNLMFLYQYIQSKTGM